MYLKASILLGNTVCPRTSEYTNKCVYRPMYCMISYMTYDEKQ